MTQPESLTSLPLAEFYDSAEVADVSSSSDLPDDLDFAPSSTYVYLLDLIGELDPSVDPSFSVDSDESIDSGLLFAEDFPEPTLVSPEDEDRMNCYFQLEDSVEIPDF